jgi:hypothetical protein
MTKARFCAETGVASDNHTCAVHQEGIRPSKLQDTGRHLGDLRFRVRPGVPEMGHESAYRPKLDLSGEIHLD